METFPFERDLCSIPIFKVYVQEEMGYVNYPVNLTPKFPSVCLLQSENSMIQRLETDLTIVKNLTLKLGPILQYSGLNSGAHICQVSILSYIHTGSHLWILGHKSYRFSWPLMFKKFTQLCLPIFKGFGYCYQVVNDFLLLEMGSS